MSINLSHGWLTGVDLFKCFKDGRDQLVVAYSMTPAFG